MRRLLLFSCLFSVLLPAYGQEVTLDVPTVVLSEVPFQVTLHSDELLFDAADAAAYAVRLDDQTYAFTPGDDPRTLVAEGMQVSSSGVHTVALMQNDAVIMQASARAIPGWLSVLPPLLAIAVALAFKRVIPALFLGIWVGAWTAVGATGLGRGLLDTMSIYVKEALVDADRIAIILFTFMIGGMVGIVSKSGGTQGIVNKIIAWARSARRGQVAAGVLGLAIFFDDYANTLVVGNTMRPVTDRLRISREKLAYIVDSTAAPVACLAFVTTWIGYEVGIIGAAVGQIDGFNEAAYSIFLNSIPYSFYPILAIFFVFSVAYSRRDFGPMYHAEVRARTTGKVLGDHAKVDEEAAQGREVQPKPGQPQRAVNAVVPIVVLVGGVLVGLFVTGEGDSLRDIVGSADSYTSLMWASLASVLVAGVLAISQRILTLEETVEAWYAGLKSMLFAMIILVLAWSLSDITGLLHTADYLVSILSGALHPGFLPMLVFILSAFTAFATGSSWGTMGILMPLVVPLAWAVLDASGEHSYAEHAHIIYSTVSVVLAGSVWGDHCSPISDTTILSSMASGCDHVEHVRTQIPYAMLVGGVALLLGTLPTGFGFPWWASLLIGGVVLWGALRYFGKEVEEATGLHQPETRNPKPETRNPEPGT